MQAADVMTPDVITARAQSEASDIAELLLTHNISAVPIIDDDGRVLGMVSEGDLMRRIQSSSDERQSWWLKLFGDGASAADYVKSHGRKAREIMTPDPVTITEDEPLHRIAGLLEKHRIKRVPVIRDGRLVGIVSRSNLLRGFSASRINAGDGSDREIRDAILGEVEKSVGMLLYRLNVIVADGNVQLWGLVDSHDQKRAVQVAAERVNGVRAIENNLGFLPPGVGA
ncbi:CBS domain-containing protein [Halomonas piscis]|uniref:CBS domain-containing protein n=1 Tax=Halomonas piscis TaxID=3031727 RepID=A0ABY9YXN4_9GAMM|nr:CBS domain-containing protein [Halomonas piscis]WNK19377.1 CBS domain-containing protein [Halomonas piscis]